MKYQLLIINWIELNYELCLCLGWEIAYRTYAGAINGLLYLPINLSFIRLLILLSIVFLLEYYFRFYTKTINVHRDWPKVKDFLIETKGARQILLKQTSTGNCFCSYFNYFTQIILILRRCFYIPSRKHENNNSYFIQKITHVITTHLLANRCTDVFPQNNFFLV